MFAIAAAAAAAASPSLADDQLHAVHVGEATAAAAAARSTQSAHTSNNQGQRAPSEVDDAEDNDGNQWTEESLKELKNKELQAILVGSGLRKTGNKKDLIDRILGREVVVDKRKKKIKWRNSKARAMLVRMLMDKDSNAHTMTWQQLHSSHEWFQEYDAKSFQRYVSELKKANPKKIAVVTEDNKIINAELQKFPRPDKTLRGEPFWDTHPSKLLLRQDVKLGKHLEMKPKTLHQTRLEYQAFSLKTFRQHVYQEKRHQKELPMRVNRRNKKAQYKYEKEVKENVTIWEAEMSGRDDEMIEAVLSDEVLSDEDDLRVRKSCFIQSSTSFLCLRHRLAKIAFLSCVPSPYLVSGNGILRLNSTTESCNICLVILSDILKSLVWGYPILHLRKHTTLRSKLLLKPKGFAFNSTSWRILTAAIGRRLSLSGSTSLRTAMMCRGSLMS